jgi:hypothetical protein
MLKAKNQLKIQTQLFRADTTQMHALNMICTLKTHVISVYADQKA